MQPTYIARGSILDFSSPLPRYIRSDQPQAQIEQNRSLTPLTPALSSKRPRPKAPYRIQWEEHPHDPSKTLGPPYWVVRNQLFAVEFRIVWVEDFSLIAYFYAKVLPSMKGGYALACERLRTNTLERVPLFVPRAGVYCLEIMIIPEDPSYRPARYRHQGQIKVLEKHNNIVQLGAYEHRIGLGVDITEPKFRCCSGNTEAIKSVHDPTADAALATNIDIDHQNNDEDAFFPEWVDLSTQDMVMADGWRYGLD